MQRMILRIVVMLLTFALGVVANWLILRRHVNNSPPPCMVEAVNPAPLEPLLSAAAPVAPVASLPAPTPKPYFVLDYDPEMLNPYGAYYMIEPKPKEFAGFESFELGLYGDDTEPGEIRIFTRSIAYHDEDETLAVFALITKDRLMFATSETLGSGVEYRFEGKFLRTDFNAVADKNTAVLRGVLTRSKNGRTLAEKTVSFRFENLGC